MELISGDGCNFVVISAEQRLEELGRKQVRNFKPASALPAMRAVLNRLHGKQLTSTTHASPEGHFHIVPDALHATQVRSRTISRPSHITMFRGTHFTTGRCDLRLLRCNLRWLRC